MNHYEAFALAGVNGYGQRKHRRFIERTPLQWALYDLGLAYQLQLTQPYAFATPRMKLLSATIITNVQSIEDLCTQVQLACQHVLDQNQERREHVMRLFPHTQWDFTTGLAWDEELRQETQRLITIIQQNLLDKE